jgi:hypothetical protein
MAHKPLYHYYGIFCKCGAFLPLWKAPDQNKQIKVGITPGEQYEIFCDACNSRVSFGHDSRIFLVESSRAVGRFKPPRGKG